MAPDDEETEEDRQAKIERARIELAECRGRHKTAMARKSSVARRTKSTSGEHAAVPRPS